jgi:hypothetical protein
MMVMKDPALRRQFGYDRARYDLSYETLVEQHGSAFSRQVENMMNNGSLSMLFRTQDVNNPQGDMQTIFERRYMMRLEERREIEAKRIHGIVREADESPITQATPSALDEIIPAAAPDEEELEQRGSLDGRENNGVTTTVADLRTAISEITGQPPPLTATEIAGYTPDQDPVRTAPRLG